MNLTKLVINGALLCLTTTAFCVCQLSIFGLAKRKTANPTAQWFCSITVVLIIPEVMSILYISWQTSFLANGNFRKWPRLKNILTGTIVSVLEMICICLLLVEVAPAVPNFCLVAILNAILLGRFFIDTVRHQRSNLTGIESRRWVCCNDVNKLKVFRIFLLFIGVGLFISVAILLRMELILSAYSTIGPFLSVMVLSLIWLPLSKNESYDEFIIGNNASLVYHVIKIVSICLIMSSFFLIDTKNNVSDILNLETLRFDSFTIGLLIICSCSLVLCNILTSLSTKFCANRIVLNGATVVSGAMIIGISIYCSATGSVLFVQSVDVIWTFNGSLYSYIFVVLCVLLWALPFIMKKVQLYRDAQYLLAPIKYLFRCYSCQPFFLTQHLFLNYTPDGILQWCSSEDSNERPTRVFICTTMYREAEYEMRRLLVSLKKLSLSKRIKEEKIYTEAHIFLDGGADGGKLREFALQLLSLVSETLSVDIVSGVGSQTSYGLQMLWTVPGGMQIFFHFKDNTKVKAKKRWSQVMYMKYITEYRARKSLNFIPVNDDVNDDHLKSTSQKNEMEDGLTHVSITVTDENGNVFFIDNEKNDDTPNIDNKKFSGLVYLSKDNLSMYSDLSDEDYDMSDSLSVGSFVSDRSEATVLKYMSYPNAGSCTSLDLLSLGSCSSLNDLTSDQHYSQINETCVVGGKMMACDSNKTPVINGVTTNTDCVTDFSRQNIFTISGPSLSSETAQTDLDDRSYILATDADMGFDEDAVLDVVKLSNENLAVGGICGRTHPIGKHQSPLVWNQMFEYGKDFWTTKTSQNVIGSVMCCPGCFSLYRLTAVADVLSEYSAPTLDEIGVFTKDTGEDRWMCTLMMMRGWQLKYSFAGRNTTYCPDNINEFIKQRRRWILSDLANSYLVLKNIRQLIAGNSCFSLAFSLYLLQLLTISVLSPGSTIIMFAVGFDFTFDVPFYIGAPVSMALLLIYVGVCVGGSRKTVVEQVTKWLMILTGLAGCIVIGGSSYFVIMDVVRDAEDGTLQFQEHFIIYAVGLSLLYAVILHPRDAWILVCGFTYIFFFAAMHMVLPVYTICNLVDQSWGTRDNQKAEVPKRIHLPKMKKLKRKVKKRKKTNKVRRLTEDDVSSVFEMEGREHYPEEKEQDFWRILVHSLLGPEANQGTSKEELASMLQRLRKKSVVIFLLINVVWVTVLCLIYGFVLSSVGGTNALGILFGILYGYALIIQVVGMTICRTNDVITATARRLCDTKRQIWIQPKEI